MRRRHGHAHPRPQTVRRRSRLMGDVALYRRLFGQARPYWLPFPALFTLGLLASPLALLNPGPLRVGGDSVLGGGPLPGFLPTGLAAAVTPTPAAPLLVASDLRVRG